ncbi:MAG: hypothetical protein Q8P48_03000 [Deltaproteobacteria bacterium]|nr:hypothetical protein [Deltaproteobacteria bacterium]
MTNLSSSEGDELEKFLEAHGLKDATIIMVATHSVGGREWRLEAGRTPAFFPDTCFAGGWYVFTDEDVRWLRLVSATSGSSLTAEKDPEGTWKVTLEVPIMDDGQPYQGAYWASFHEALSLVEG